MADLPRIAITGVGLTSPLGNSLSELRASLLACRSGVQKYEIRYVGDTLAGICDYDTLRHQKRREVRRGTRVGSIACWCANEALADSGLDLETLDRSRLGVYTGVTEHGNVETENEIHDVSKYDFDLRYWSHHHNPRTVANNPAGEVTINLGLSGPAYSLGGACAAGNLGLVHGAQMLQLGECDVALAGGLSEAIHTFGIYASFQSQGALARHDDPTKASRPFDRDRNGIVISEGGCLYTLERMDEARARGARIYGEVLGWAVNSDGTDFVLPDPVGQNACIRGALTRAGVEPGEVDLISTHATSTESGDTNEAQAVNEVFGDFDGIWVNNTKSYIGHAMGAAAALELAGNLPSFEDKTVHPTINLDNLDPTCEIRGLVANEPREVGSIDTILNMSFGMLGINSAVVVRAVRD
ncbi:MAG: beta-ketoacyl-[acyl-carrier-protein] synthase family protein [Planctomycetota bacterium]